MLTQKQVNEIREYLEKAQNPLFFFDNDQDGLCSFLLFQRFTGKGKGVAIKSFPGLNANYFRKVRELNTDYIFVLDKHSVSDDFLKEAEQINIPIVWIDHHESQHEIPDFVHYYNPLLNEEKTNEPVTALCYQVTERKEDLWLAVAGCISEKFIPDFYSEFYKRYPDLGIDYEKDSGVYSKIALDIYYGCQIGKIATMLGFALKDRTTNVIKMIKFLGEVKTPYEVLEENKKNYTMHRRFEQINKKYKKLMEKAEDTERISKDKKVLFFQYGGDLSISTDLANKLKYLFPEKIVVVAYTAGVKSNISVRGGNIREKVLKIIEGLEDATGGGHEDAVGVRIRTEDLEKFRRGLEK